MAMSFAQSLQASGPGRAFKRGIGRGLGFEYEHGVNKGWMGRGLEKGGKTGMFAHGKMAFAFRALGPAMVAHSIYKGYQEGGILGAAKSGATELAFWGAFEVGASIITNPVTIAGAGIAAAGYGYYKAGEASRKHRKRLRNVEMGSDLVDRFGTMTTMRQRSLAAIQNTHINGRGALGSEAAILSSGSRGWAGF